MPSFPAPARVLGRRAQRRAASRGRGGYERRMHSGVPPYALVVLVPRARRPNKPGARWRSTAGRYYRRKPNRYRKKKHTPGSVAAYNIVTVPRRGTARSSRTAGLLMHMLVAGGRWLVVGMLSCLFPTPRIPWFPHHTFLPPRHTNKNPIRRLPIIINLLKFVVLSSLRCLVPVRFSIIVTT